MKLVCLSLALICIQGTSAALNMIRRDPMVTFADQGTTLRDMLPPTTTVDHEERTSIHWDDHHHDWHNDHLNDIVHVTESVHHWDDHHSTPIPHLDTTTHLWGNTHDDIVHVTESVHHWDDHHTIHTTLIPHLDTTTHLWGNTHDDMVLVTESAHGPGPSVSAPKPNEKTYTCHPWSKHDEEVMEETGLHWANYCATLGFKWNGGNYAWTPGCGKCRCCKPNIDQLNKGPVTSPQDYPYKKYKNKQCQDVNWYAKGCFKTKVPFTRGKLLVYWRHDIEWAKNRIGSFASSLACACAEAARANGVKFFGLHYWGECWALDIGEITGDPHGDCILADGKYETKCVGHFNKHWNPGCLAIESYMLHVVFDSDDRPDFPIVMEK